MQKTLLIIQREYLTRVRKKSFLVTTFLIPILMMGLIGGIAYLSAQSEQKEAIAVWDESGLFLHRMDTASSTYSIHYLNPVQTTKEYQALLDENHCDILLHVLPFKAGKPDSINLYREGGVSLNAKEFLLDNMNTIFQTRQLEAAGMDKASIDSINQVSISIKSFDLKNLHETSSEIATAIGYVTGFLIYIVILLYGMGVMRGVMEEKTNRIAEVIISSVKPFQLMMGKIMGIALVGLTQFMLWLLLSLVLQTALPFLIPGLHGSITSGMQTQQALQQLPSNQLAVILDMLMKQNWTLIVSSFMFYFLGGYFLYAAMFAAVGSLVNEDPQEAQQMTLPVTMPIILGFFIMSSAIKDPNSPLAVFGSLFPLTSPMVMMARIAYGVPAWQLIASMLLLVGGFIGMTWISARIYRTGILMYGKKPSWKEVFKWIRYS